RSFQVYKLRKVRREVSEESDTVKIYDETYQIQYKNFLGGYEECKMGGYFDNRLFSVSLCPVRQHLSCGLSDRFPLSGLRPDQGGDQCPHPPLCGCLGAAAFYLPDSAVAGCRRCAEILLPQEATLRVAQMGRRCPHLRDGCLLRCVHV